MKEKIRTLMILITVLCLPLTAVAEEHTFPAGSLIVPMDNFYQPEDDGGVLEAYGLIYYLLSHTDADGNHDITVYWVVNVEKTTIDGVDLVIEDLTLGATDAVVKLYDHAGGTQAVTFNTAGGDNNKRITYRGGVFILDVEGASAALAKSIVDSYDWLAVEVHEAQVPFSAPVFREMIGTPPKIALMNNREDKTGGNVAILESYLRLAGLCQDTFEVVTPNEIRDGILRTGGYDFLWAPHWHGDDADQNSNGIADDQETVAEVRVFVESGKGVLAECASITEFEHYGRFLTDYGFGHNGGTNDRDTIIYNDVTSANSQIGDFVYEPEGGSLHNWKPYVDGDPINKDPLPDMTADNPSSYNDTVSRFTVDNTGWDYYVGGYADGDRNHGYVVYLGGHKYASCGGTYTVDPARNEIMLDFEFGKEFKSDKVYTIALAFSYNSGSTTTVVFDTDDDFSAIPHVGDPLEIDLTTARAEKNKILDVTLRNNGASTVTIDALALTWSGGHAEVVNQRIKKITDTTNDVELFKGELDTPFAMATTDFTIDALASTSAGCTNNDDCDWSNIAGVRYVLNTLLNIKYQITSREYARSAPIVKHPWLYQGSFEHPSYLGHFRRYDVTQTAALKVADWDTGSTDPRRITDANNNNGNGRKVYTAELIAGSWSRIDFDNTNLSGKLDAPLNVTPGDGDTSDEEAVLTRVRGKRWDSDNSQWLEQANKLGGIMHSAPAIVDHNSRTGSRDEVAYVGDLYGMLHAVYTASGNEKWAFIPRNLLGKLQNDRTDPNAVQNFAAVDGSPTVKDVYYDQDGDGDKEWRTVLVCPQGWGGNYLFALDITDPDDPLVLWELTVEAILSYTGAGGFAAGTTVTGETSGATGQVVAEDAENDELSLEATVGVFQVDEKIFVDADGDGVLDVGEDRVTITHIVEMGHAYRASINKVRWPVRDGQGDITGYELKWVVYAASGYLNIAEDHGGINVFAFDLKTGDKLWHFSDEYLSSVNDIPGAVTLFDSNGDNFMDRVYMGDMDGRLWELDAVDGTNPNGTVVVDSVTKQMPLWNAGVGKPISISPAITRVDGHVVLIFGTGGADWAANDQAYSIYVVDATDKQASPTYWDSGTEQGGTGTLLWGITLDEGEKVWSAPTVAAGKIYVATVTGTMESDSPGEDLAGVGYLYSLDLETGSKTWQDEDSADEDIQKGRLEVGKARGSIYVDSQHVYLTTIDNQVVQVGDGNFTGGNANNAVLKAWRQF